MENSLLTGLVHSLSKMEVREVRQFLASPFFNLRSDVQALFEESLAGLPPSSGEGGGPASVWEKIYPGQPFDGQQWRLLCSYLFKLLEQYLVLKENEVTVSENYHLLLAAYRRRKLTRHFEKTQRSVTKTIENQPLRHPEFFMETYRVAHLQYAHLLESGRTKELNLQVAETELTTAFIAMKLRQACLLRAHQAVFNTEYRNDLLEETLALARLPPYAEAPAVSVYWHCYRALFGEESEAHFAAFKNQLFVHSHRFPKDEMAALYLLALNFCIKKINASQRAYLREALDLYREGLKTGLLLENGQLSRFAYNNIVGIALRMSEEWKWAEEFVATYRPLLDATHREATYSLNCARLAYARRQYDEALMFLQKADYKDLINGMVARVLQLKIYFEKSEFNLLDAHLKTMRMFIRRNKRMGYHHRNWQNVVHFTQKLMELSPYDEAGRLALREAIGQAEVLTEKEWMLGQLE